MIEAKIDKSEIEKLQRFFNATAKQLKKASHYALSDTIKHLKSELIKGTATQYYPKIQQKALTEKMSNGSSRINYSSLSEIKVKNYARLWFGTYRISLARLNPHQVGKGGSKKRKNSRAGVTAGVSGSIFREGAFLMPIRSRSGTSVVPYQVMKRLGKARLPIKKEMFEYEGRALRVEKKIFKQVPDFLAKKLKERLIGQLSK